MIPIAVGIFWEIKKITQRVIKPEYLSMVYLLILFDPAIVTQIILMGYDLFLLYFVLLSVRTLLEKKFLLYSVCLLLLSAISIRGILFVFCLLLIHGIFLLFIEKNKPKIRDGLIYLPALLFLLLWSLFHFFRTGWMFSNPELIAHRRVNDLTMVFRQMGYSVWKILDSGRIALWAFCMVSFFLINKKIHWSDTLKKTTLLLIIPLLVNVFLMAFISNPIGHKYFLQTFIFLSIAVVYFLQEITSRIKRILIFLSLLLMFAGGNFILYPQKFGNAWDTSLKVLPFFKAERQMKAFIEKNKIKPSEVYTDFPLNVNNRYSYLREDFSYSELKSSELSICPYVLYSNILNVADLSTYTRVKREWKPLYSVCGGQVIISLYLNPAFKK